MTLTATDRTDALAERLFEATLGALELFSVYLGAELGLYRALATHGPLTADGAGRARRHRTALRARVARAAGRRRPARRRGRRRRGRRAPLRASPPDHARVLADPDDPAHVAPFAHMLAGIGGVLPAGRRRLPHRRRRPYAALRRATSAHGQGHINRPAFTARAADGLARRDARRRRAPARAPGRPRRRRRLRPGLVDARASPAPSRTPTSTASTSTPPSIADARATPRRPGVDGRVRFLDADAGALAEHGPYDLVLHPRGAARHGATRSRRCAPRARRSRPAARCSSSTSGSPTRSPRPATRSSG